LVAAKFGIYGLLQFGHLVFLSRVAVVLKNHFSRIASPGSSLGHWYPSFNPAADGGVSAIIWPIRMGKNPNVG
jgi:hypothetical protein